MKMSKRITYVLALTFLLFLAYPTRTLAGKYGIQTISHTPDYISPNTNLTVSIEFSDTSDIETIRLLICQLSPEFKCEPKPILMEEETNVFTGVFYITYEAGSSLGYHFLISYTNGTDVEVPDSIDFLGLTTIVEPVEDSFYIKVDVNEPLTEDTPGFMITFAVPALLIITIYRKKRKLNLSFIFLMRTNK
ncbi:MAG: hypothetical protein ACTSQE_09330 [Candidatus Heimdallarchaeaceae archaeon]